MGDVFSSVVDGCSKGFGSQNDDLFLGYILDSGEIFAWLPLPWKRFAHKMAGKIIGNWKFNVFNPIEVACHPLRSTQ